MTWLEWYREPTSLLSPGDQWVRETEEMEVWAWPKRVGKPALMKGKLVQRQLRFRDHVFDDETFFAPSCNEDRLWDPLITRRYGLTKQEVLDKMLEECDHDVKRLRQKESYLNDFMRNIYAMMEEE